MIRSLAHAEPFFKVPRFRSKGHLRWIAEHQCAVPGCYARLVIAHHLTITQPKGRGMKSGDDHAVPLCQWVHHDARSPHGVHFVGDERAWWAALGVDPIKLAAEYWERSPFWVDLAA